ncbi:MAG: orotidine-5'-phosphate decarboxylase [Oscillospiraceae bacterium]|nr:orotidine-5'-phosphate decarboxylase [Oscillospiraceae bacterium]
MSFKNLQEKINKKQNPSVMGLDPKLEYIPEHIITAAVKEFGRTKKAAGEAIFSFNKGLIDCCHDLIPAVKPQSAYYEMYGIDGICALHRTIEYAKSKDLYVILDAKRGDIGATCEAYSAAYLGEVDIFGQRQPMLDCDCLTVNPYLGFDGIEPFMEDCKKFNKSIFVLVKTSNKSSGDFQDIEILKGGTLYEKVARSLLKWGSPENTGAVIGATYPLQLEALRAFMPDTFFLVPGFGAQGGAADDLKHAFDKNGERAIINSSRALMCAYKTSPDKTGVEYGKWTREEVIHMREAINEVRL